MVKTSQQLGQIETEPGQAIAAKKCWRCGCVHDAVNTLRNSVASEIENKHSDKPSAYGCGSN